MFERINKWNLIIFFVVVVLLIGSIFFLWMKTNMEVRSVVEEQYQNQQLLLTKQAASSIERSLVEKILLIEVIAKKESGIPPDNFASDMKSVHDVAGLFYVIEFVDKNGTIVAGYPEEHVPYDYNLYEHGQYSAFERVRASGKVYITDPIELIEGNYGSFVWFPVFQNGVFSGAFIAIIEETELKRSYVVESGTSDHAYLIDGRGRFLYDESGRYERGSHYVDILSLDTSGMGSIIAEQMNGTAGSGKFFVYASDGFVVEDRLVSYVPINWYNQRWSLAITSPASKVDELIVPVYVKLFIVAVVSVIFIVFVSSLIFLILFNWNKSLENEVDEKTRELKVSNESLIDANKKLKELDRLKTEFLSIVSHELKTPLTAMKTSSEFLRENDVYDASLKNQMLDIIIRNIDRQARMVDELLDVSRIESNRMKFRADQVNIEDVIVGALEILDASIKQKEMEVIIHTPANLPLVITDKDKLVQVFVNLLNNAVKFSNQKGTIIINVKEEKEFVKISITDKGSGMNNWELENIFDKFYQIDSTSTRRFGGSGLGLSIVKGIIEGQGGKITVQSELGKGSTFTFTLKRG